MADPRVIQMEAATARPEGEEMMKTRGTVEIPPDMTKEEAEELFKEVAADLLKRRSDVTATVITDANGKLSIEIRRLAS